MKKQYIKVPIPEQISEDGGASILFVNKQTVPLDGAISEALAGNYCTGQATLIRNFFFGLMQSMADGVRRDGHARQIANFLTVYPVFKGEVDMDRGYDPEVNGVMIRARLLNEMDLDITDWSFEDVTEGKRSFSLTSCTTGEVDGVYQVGELGHLNGKDLPSTAAGDELRVHWQVEGTDKSGDIPAAKLSSEIDRVDIAADALDELKEEAYDGKTIVFTVRGNFSSAKISAKLKVLPPEPLVTSSDGFVKVMSIDEDPIPALGRFTVRGVNVGYKSSDPEQGLPDHGLMGALATVDGQSLSWHCTVFDDEHASEATFESDGSEEPLEPGEYTAALTLNYAVDDGTGVSHLEPLVIENVKFTVSE